MNCLHCGEPILPTDWPPSKTAGLHWECNLRLVLGSVAHQRRQCSCYGGSGEDDPSMTRREAALAAACEWSVCHREANQ